MGSISVNQNDPSFDLYHATGKPVRTKMAQAKFKKYNTNKKKVKEVIAFVKTNGGLDYAIHKMHEFQHEANLILDSFPASEAKDSLQKLVSYVIDREF